MRKLLFAATLAAAGFAVTAVQAQIVPYIGSIIALGAKFCPENWLQADGRHVPIPQYEALFKVIGTTYGGDGQKNFALPKLTGGTFGPEKHPLTWCIAEEGAMPINPPPNH